MRIWDIELISEVYRFNCQTLTFYDSDNEWRIIFHNTQDFAKLDEDFVSTVTKCGSNDKMGQQ